MPNPYKAVYTPQDDNLTGIASNVTGASFTLTAEGADDGLGHLISIRNDSGTDHSGKTVTLVGTDPEGRALTEVVPGPGGSATVTSTKYFKTVTSATPSATIGADTFDIGWTEDCIGPTYMMNHEASEFNVSYAWGVSGSNITYALQYTFQDPGLETNAQDANWITDSTIITETTDQELSSTKRVRAVRLAITALGASNETIEFNIIQGR